MSYLYATRSAINTTEEHESPPSFIFFSSSVLIPPRSVQRQQSTQVQVYIYIYLTGNPPPMDALSIWYICESLYISFIDWIQGNMGGGRNRGPPHSQICHSPLKYTKRSPFDPPSDSQISRQHYNSRRGRRPPISVFFEGRGQGRRQFLYIALHVSALAVM